MGLFSHHKTFYANVIDPGGFMGGGTKGFFAKTSDIKAANEKRDAEEAAKNRSTPSVYADEGDDPERLKRIGRAQLVTSSSRGVLTNADTSSRSLFGVQ